jgi:hypothetical protein
LDHQVHQVQALEVGAEDARRAGDEKGWVRCDR